MRANGKKSFCIIDVGLAVYTLNIYASASLIFVAHTNVSEAVQAAESRAIKMNFVGAALTPFEAAAAKDDQSILSVLLQT